MTHSMKPKAMHATNVGLSQQECKCGLEVWVAFPTKQIHGKRFFWKEVPPIPTLAVILDSIPCERDWEPSGPDWKLTAP
jgi:hypothetical protein